MKHKGIVVESLCVLIVFAVLYWISTVNYVLFHSLVELGCVIIAWTIYVVGLNARQFPGTDFFQFLGISFLFVAAMNVMHIFSFTGLGIFTADDETGTGFISGIS